MTREEAILWMRVLKHSKINWVGEKDEEEDIIKRCEEAEQEAFDMAIEALSAEIVRCKDCRYYECAGLPCPLDVCESLGDDGFCSCGERKGGDTE